MIVNFYRMISDKALVGASGIELVSKGGGFAIFKI
jgi:hypothetical protein